MPKESTFTHLYDLSPCRIVLLTISMLCVLMTFIVIGLIVRYKRLKVIKAGSPIFLTVTLLGCVAMYMEVRCKNVECRVFEVGGISWKWNKLRSLELIPEWKYASRYGVFIFIYFCIVRFQQNVSCQKVHGASRLHLRTDQITLSYVPPSTTSCISGNAMDLYSAFLASFFPQWFAHLDLALGGVQLPLPIV